MDNAEPTSLNLSIRNESIKESLSRHRSFDDVINRLHWKIRNVWM